MHVSGQVVRQKMIGAHHRNPETARFVPNGAADKIMVLQVDNVGPQGAQYPLDATTRKGGQVGIVAQAEGRDLVYLDTVFAEGIGASNHPWGHYRHALAVVSQPFGEGYGKCGLPVIFPVKSLSGQKNFHGWLMSPPVFLSRPSADGGTT